MTMDLESKIACRCRVRRAAIPKVRDPFINTRLLPLGAGADGRERFWTSSCNMVQGTQGVVVNEDGEARVHVAGVPHWNLYAAVQADADTLWLCNRMSRLLKFSIGKGVYECFPTGLPDAMVGEGPVYDRATGKLFLAGFHDLRTTAFSFDTRAKQTVRVHRDFPGSHCMRFSFPNGDGTWSLVITGPGQSLLRWDPRRETLSSLPLPDERVPHAPLAARLVRDGRGRWYVPERGWFDPRARRFERGGPRPAREMTWFDRRGATAFGAEDHEGAIDIHSWDLKTGSVRRLCTVPDAQIYSCALSRSGRIVAVNVYGVFYRYNGRTGALELSKPLPTDAVSHVDCLCPISRDRLLGTSFITQRFWELDLKTGRGADCGRAAPGWGEVARTWKTGGKVYMAAYIGGELVEYDPAAPPRFPENPRVVAKPPRGQRPIAAADDGRRLFYSCTRPYPALGSVLTRYDTATGLAAYGEDPLPDQKITGLAYVKASGSLLCGTSMHADMKSGAPSSDRCYLACISAATLVVEKRILAPPGTEEVNVIGPLGRGTWLCTFALREGIQWAAIDSRTLRPPSRDGLRELPEKARRIQGAGRPGLFLLRWADRIELWDMRTVRRIKTLVRNIGGDFYVGGVFVEARSVMLATPWEIVVLENALA